MLCRVTLNEVMGMMENSVVEDRRNEKPVT